MTVPLEKVSFAPILTPLLSVKAPLILTFLPSFRVTVTLPVSLLISIALTSFALMSFALTSLTAFFPHPEPVFPSHGSTLAVGVEPLAVAVALDKGVDAQETAEVGS